MAGRTVAAAFAAGLADYAASRGVDRARLMACASVAPAELETAEQRVPLDKYIRLMRAAADLSDDPAFALRFGEEVDIREMSIVALLGQSLGSVMEAFEATNRYARLDADVETDGDNRFELVREAGKLWLVDRRANSNATPELTESAFARMVSAGRRAGIAMPLRAVHFTHAEPAYRQEYERIFGVPVTFGSRWNALNIDDGAMAQPVALQPALAGRILAQRADSLLRDLDAGRSTRGQVETVLRSLLRNSTASVASVAAKLGVSRQTLFRRLRAEGTSYERLLRALRQELARDYLADGTLSVAEIGCRLGYADGPSFSKAFKRWTGSTPSAALGRGRH
jgi:AraC-like DNA-binding protein